MEEILKSALEHEEKILWRGGPEEYTGLDLTHKRYFIKHCIISVVVAIAITIAYFVLAAKNGAEIKTGLLLIAYVFCAYKPLAIMSDARKLKRDTIYVVTDKRLLVVRDGVKAVELSRINEAAFKTDADGHTSLLCGKEAVESAPVKWREFCIYGEGAVDEDAKYCERFAFYAVKELESLKETVTRVLPNVK